MSFTQVKASQFPPGRADLDAIERTLEQFEPSSWVRQHVPGLVAELRAARTAGCNLYPIVADLAYFAAMHGDPDGEVARLAAAADQQLQQITGDRP